MMYSFSTRKDTKCKRICKLCVFYHFKFQNVILSGCFKERFSNKNQHKYKDGVNDEKRKDVIYAIKN